MANANLLNLLKEYRGGKVADIQGYGIYLIIVTEHLNPFDPPTYFWHVVDVVDDTLEAISDNTHDCGEVSKLLAIAAARRTIDYTLHADF